MRLALVLLAVVALTTNAPHATQQRDAPVPVGTGTAEISGKVMDAAAGRPLGRARVTLRRSNGAGRVTLTDADGRFAFPQIPAGSYEIEASLDAYLPARFGQRKPRGAGTPVVVTDRQKIFDLVISLTRGSVLTGLAMDSLGKPLVDATVQALRWRFSEDGSSLGMAASDTTDDRGQYRIFGLEPGEYLVMVEPRTESLTPQMGGADAVQPRVESVAPSFFPGTPSASHATAVRLAPGEERAGVDVVVPLLPLATISGSVTTISGQRLDSGSVQLVPDGDVSIGSAEPRVASLAANGFSFGGVAPGSYVLTAMSNLSLFGVTRVLVGGRDVNDVSLVLQRGVTVSGRLRVSPGSTAALPPYSISLNPLVNSTGLGGTLFVVSRPDAQGRITLKDVPPGPFRFECTPCDAPWVLQSISYQGRELIDLPFDVGTEDIAEVELTFSNTPAQIAGMTADTSGQPIADATVILFPADKKLWTPSATGIRAVQSGPDGRYQFRRSRAGEFLIAAVDEVEPNQWFDPRFLERIADKATRVKLSLSDRQALDLRIVSTR